MKIAQINMLSYGSTGKIMLQIAQTARNAGYEVKTYSPVVFSRFSQEKVSAPTGHMEFGNYWENCFHYYCGSLLGIDGCFSQIGTRQLIRELEDFQPDIIHLHNVHGYRMNLSMLFNYIKQHNVKVIWTLHDCWAFTGHCPHFTIAKCEKWKNGCHHCPQPRVYPKMYLDASRYMYEQKKKWFCGIADMTIVTPSQWLADLVQQSFLKSYPVKVINNGIDLTVFKPQASDFRKRYGIRPDEYMLLSVAFGWSTRKGMNVFIELAKRLDSSYRIVMVGTDDKVDEILPKNIISIHCTQNQQELAQIYTAADLFVNPTREENYPTVNMESIACGTPVLTFCTGGSPEILDETCGSVVDCDDVDALEREILRNRDERPYSEAACLKRAKDFDKQTKFEEYITLYDKN